MDLFEYAKSKTLDRESPLASRLRPTTLDEVVGQEHIVGKDKLLYCVIKADKLTSVIFYGPPWNRKDYPCQGNCKYYQCKFYQINATVAGKERHGRSRKRGTGPSWHVWQKNDSFH